MKQDIIEKMNELWLIGKMPKNVQNALMFLSCNLLNDKSNCDFLLVKPLIEHSISSLWEKEDEILSDALWGISFFIGNSQDNLIESGITNPIIIRQIISLAKSTSDKVKLPAIRCIGNISSGKDTFGLILIKEGAIEILELALGTRKNQIVQDACWALSNLLCCGADIITIYIKQNIFQHAKLLLRTKKREIIRAALWLFGNALDLANEEQLGILVKLKIINDLGELLGCDETEIQYNILRSLVKVLRKAKSFENQDLYKEMLEKLQESGGQTNIEKIQLHQNKILYELAVQILKEHYEFQEDFVQEKSLLVDPPMLLM